MSRPAKWNKPGKLGVGYIQWFGHSSCGNTKMSKTKSDLDFKVDGERVEKNIIQGRWICKISTCTKGQNALEKQSRG